MKQNFYANVIEGKENQGPVLGDPYFLQTKEETENWLNEKGVTGYKINEDLTVDTKYDVYLNDKNIKKISVKFNIVDGDFNCSVNNLTSLKGCPEVVKGSFNCSNNKLTNLEYLPKQIRDSIHLNNNSLTSLNGSPERVTGSFNCSNNKLTSLEGSPVFVSKTFDCSDNKLTSLKGNLKSVIERFKCDYNENLTSLKHLPQIGAYLTFGKTAIKSLEGITKVTPEMLLYLIKIEETSKLSWIPIKDILKDDVVFYNHSNQEELEIIVNNYIKILKGSEIDNIDEYIRFLYEAIKNNKQENISQFCKTILKDIEELQVY